jgi:hypothetical protein
MKGFEIKINDKKVIRAVSDSLTSISIGTGYFPEDNYIYIGGIDSKSDHLTWLDKKLKLGDKIKVKVMEIDRISPLIRKKLSDKNKLKERYDELKRELEDNGLI